VAPAPCECPPAARWAGPLTACVYQRTDGNALFMVNLVEHLVQQGRVVRQTGQWTLRKGSGAQPASCWQRSTAGSRRALTRPTSRRPKPCWPSWGPRVVSVRVPQPAGRGRGGWAPGTDWRTRRRGVSPLACQSRPRLGPPRRRRRAASAHGYWRIEMTTASPPRLSISPVRFAFRCMITPASFCSQRSPALAMPIAKP
jgi:hypothetical protein